IPESAMVCPQVGDGIMVQPKALAPLQFPHSIPQASPIVPPHASFEARDKVASKPDSRIARHAARRNVGVHQKERTTERTGGHECFSTWRYRCAANHEKK